MSQQGTLVHLTFSHHSVNITTLHRYVYFPDLGEESYLFLNEACSMLCYAASEAGLSGLEEPHIYAHQRKVMQRKGAGADAFTVHNYAR